MLDAEVSESFLPCEVESSEVPKFSPERETVDKQLKKIASCMQRDRFRLHKTLQKLRAAKAIDQQQLAKTVADVEASVQLLEKRKLNLPPAELDTKLPISQRRNEIAEAISSNQVVVISGETGSGKSTQLPLIALQLGLGVQGYIGHTQPRRIAARSVASRIASQLKSPLGQSVGFKIRFDDKTTESTYVKLMTDGILLAETQSDRFLDNYELIIIDEAHERSLNIDFLLGNLKGILPKRKDLKLIITSATIDTERFAEHFCDQAGNPAPIINVEGRTYPVEIRYLASENDSENLSGDAFVEHVANSTRDIAQEESGDILVFLPTENDIKQVHKKLRGAFGSGGAEILPLYARLSTQQQNAIFQQGKRRRIVLATNVAESSLTVPGIRIVVDSGTARISRYAPRSKVQRLPIEPISQASANQRSGRCGRIGPGVCLRLYDEEDFLSRPKYTTPEIRRTNLASVILQTLSMRLGDVNEFPFIDPPLRESVNDGFKTLYEIGAIDEHRKLTKLGRWLARLPVDPRIGRMLKAADDSGCLNEILIIAAALEIQDPRIRPAEKQKAADAQHEKFHHENSDFMSYLKLWDFFHKLRKELSRSKFRIACQQNFLSLAAIHQWQEVHRQLKSVVRQQGMKLQGRKDDFNAIHRSLLTGLLSGIATNAQSFEYLGAGGTKFHLWPGSGVFESKPKWIVAAEVVETTRRYGRTIGRISPEWIEPISTHLASSNFSEPHWSKKQQRVMAYESVSLFGLPIVSRRKVGYSKIDPEMCREIFIEHGLLEFQLKGTFNFLEHNRNLLEEVQQLAAKSRSRDLILDSALLGNFYEDRLPADCFDTRSLEQKIRKNKSIDKQLCLTMDDLDLQGPQVHPDLYPDSVPIGTMKLPISYKFEPGIVDDGASLQIPQEAVNQLDECQTQWLVPGLLEARVTAMIKSLPKSLRRNLIPAPETAKRVCESLKNAQGSLVTCVAIELTRLGGEPIKPEQIDQSKVDDSLFVNLQVIDENGEIIAQGRSINELRKELGTESTGFVETEDSDWHQDGLNSWTWEDLPQQVSIQRGVANVAAFPSIIDQNDSVGLRLVDSAHQADYQTRLGLVRLYKISQNKSLKRQVNWLPDFDQASLKLSSLMPSSQLKKDLTDMIAKMAFVDGKPVPRTKEEFEYRLESSVESISVATQKVAKWLPKIADAAHNAALAIEQIKSKHPTVADQINHQIAELTVNRFCITTPWKWLEHMPRYFEAIVQRCEKILAGNTVKDREVAEQVESYWQQYTTARENHQALSIHDPELIQFRWMIEEFRVSQFAQKLGTSLTVSEKRLEKQLAKIRSV